MKPCYKSKLFICSALVPMLLLSACGSRDKASSTDSAAMTGETVVVGLTNTANADDAQMADAVDVTESNDGAGAYNGASSADDSEMGQPVDVAQTAGAASVFNGEPFDVPDVVDTNDGAGAYNGANNRATNVAVVFAEDMGTGPVNGQPVVSMAAAEIAEPVSVDEVLSQSTAFYSQNLGQCAGLSEFALNSVDPFGLNELVMMLDAGEVITLQSNGNSYAELLPAESGNYEWAGENYESLPGDLVMNIPGLDFPAIENLTIPTLRDIAAVEQTTYSTGDTLTWQAGSVDNMPIWIALDYGRLICVTEDDGYFQIPEYESEIEQIQMLRRQVQVSKHGDALAIVLRTRTWEN